MEEMTAMNFRLKLLRYKENCSVIQRKPSQELGVGGWGEGRGMTISVQKISLKR